MDFQNEINLINFFTRNKNLSHKQKERFKILVARDLDNNPTTINQRFIARKLLEIWEKEGLDAAVKEWEKMEGESSEKFDKNKKKSENFVVKQDKLKENSAIEEPFDDSINVYEFDDIRSELNAIKKKLKEEKENQVLPYDMIWDDFPFLESGEPADF